MRKGGMGRDRKGQKVSGKGEGGEGVEVVERGSVGGRYRGGGNARGGSIWE